MNKSIENLAIQWEQATNEIERNNGYSIEQVEGLLRDTYKLCTEHKGKSEFSKEFDDLFANIQHFFSELAAFYHFDEFTTSSDSAEYAAVGYIVDEIEYGFSTGNYENAFPYISVNNTESKPYVLNLEEEFLEYFIDENR